MKLYSQQDMEANGARVRAEGWKTALCAIPFLVLSVIGFCVRMEWLCAAGCILCAGVIVLLWDMKLAPVLRYGRHLREVHSGLTRMAAGTLVRIDEDAVYEDGVYFHEMIINIYEDMDPEGERRFLLDGAKTLPAEWIGRDVAVVSHGHFVLEVRLMEGGHGEN